MYILTKIINNKIIFKMDDHISYDQLLEELDKLLEQPKFTNAGYYPKAYFDFKSRIIGENEMDQLIGLLLHKQTVIFSGCTFKNKIKNSFIKVINKTIHSGELLNVHDNTLIVGNIHQDAIITFDSELMIVGKVSGKLIATNKDSKLYGSNFKNASIRFVGTSRHAFTYYQPVMIYYKNNLIYVDKGDNDNV